MPDEWYWEQLEHHTRLGMQVGRRPVCERSDFQRVEIFEAERYGRVLALDGLYRTSELDEHLYVEHLSRESITPDNARRSWNRHGSHPRRSRRSDSDLRMNGQDERSG